MNKTAKANVHRDLGNVQSYLLLAVRAGFLAVLAYVSMVPG